MQWFVNLLISGFLLQAMVADQLQQSLEAIEKLVGECIKEHQSMMKSDPEYLLLQVNDQKRVVRIHEMIQTQVKNEFDDSKEKLRTRI